MRLGQATSAIMPEVNQVLSRAHQTHMPSRAQYVNLLTSPVTRRTNMGILQLMVGAIQVRHQTQNNEELPMGLE